jgi:hypothetical protein
VCVGGWVAALGSKEAWPVCVCVYVDVCVVSVKMDGMDAPKIMCLCLLGVVFIDIFILPSSLRVLLLWRQGRSRSK